MVNWHLFIMTMFAPSLHALARTKLPSYSSTGTKIKTKLKFGIDFIGKKNKDSNGEYYDRLISD